MILRILLVFLFSLSNVNAQEQELSAEELKAKLFKVDDNIENTKNQIKTVGDAAYLADLYFVLAEFLVEKSRVLYQLKIAQNPDVPVEELDFTFEKRPKEEAIAVYETFLEKFPSENRRDRALFFKAHELRELGRSDEMLKVYQRITKDFPQSNYWSEAQLNIGDVYFEQKKDFELALEYFDLIIKKQETEFTPLAYYKAGWCYINLNKFLPAYKSFESAILSSNRLIAKKIDLTSDIREEALQAMVWPYSEIGKKEITKVHPISVSSIEHFRSISFGYESYVKLLSKLGRRMKIKKRYRDAADAYFEFLKVSTDLEAKLSRASEFYQILRSNLKDVKWPGLSNQLGQLLAELKYDNKIADKEKEKYQAGIEKILRDLAIQNHRAAKKQVQYKGLAIEAYSNYLDHFEASPYRDRIRYNYAGLLFSSGSAFDAAKEYERLARTRKRKLKKSWKAILKASLESYLAALGKGQLLIHKKEQARDALRGLGQLYLKRYPKDKASSTILFNIGQSYYNERNFAEAVKFFKNFILVYPRDTQVSLAINQILDAHNQKEDYESLIKDGDWFLKNTKVANPSLRGNINEIVSQAKLLLLKKESGDFTKGTYAKNMLKMASKFKGTDLGDKALYEAFILFRSQRSEEMYKPGAVLLKSHSGSQYAKQVAGDMVRTALLTADFERAAKYLEYYGIKYPKDKESELFLSQAGEIRFLIRDYSGAKRVFGRLKDYVKIADMDYESRDWKALLSSSTRVLEPKRSFYLAKALRETGKKKLAKQILNTKLGTIKSSGKKDVLAKSIYLLAQLSLDDYRKLQFSKRTDDQVVVKKKTESLAALTAKFNNVIATGHPEMTLAALSGLGEIYKNFGAFIEKAKIPKGLTRAQKKMFEDAIAQQALNYQKQSDAYFEQCLSVAEKAELYSKYLIYCRDKSLNSKLPGAVPSFSGESSNNIQSLRKSLFDRPRDVDIYINMVKSFISEKKFGEALATANRAIEMFPENPKVYTYYSVVLLHIGDFEQAGYWLKQGVTKDAYNDELKFIESKVKRFFSYSVKKASVTSDLRSYMPGWL